MKDHSFVKYLISKEFRTQLKYALAIFFALIFIINICLWFFTRHSNKLVVPDFKGLTLVEATELADDNNMQIQIMDSVYNLLQAPGSVIEQDPKSGSSVKKHRRIFLIMNAMNPEKIVMPNVVGVSLRQAIAILELNGLMVGKLKYVPDIATNNVLNQRLKGKEIRSGKEINKGSYIDLVLGQAGGESAEVPDLIGLTKHNAEKKIALAYLNLGKIHYSESIVTSADSIKAFVQKQKPDIDAKYVAMGTKVDIWLTVEMPKEKAKKNSKTKSKRKK
jgi:beta-lactam-binding protein with PASTA domain